MRPPASRTFFLEILLKSKNQDIPLISGDLIAPEDFDISPTGQIFHLTGVPDDLMLSQAKAVQSQSDGFLD
ncbi:MAG: hypothetical protein JRG97_07940 [Deltaproteobacteria bacterium]|nr:hypothetical protein [Deltaproteobacteria bacterium]